jgi:hypothetical protein
MCVHKKINRIGRAMLMVTVGMMAVGLLAAELHSQTFVLSQNGKSVGTASLSLKQGAGGFNSTSGAKIDMPGLKYNFSANETLDSGYHLSNVQLNGSVNGTAATVNTVPQGQQFLMKINANGNVTATPLAFHPQAVFLPDFDPGALQVLLSLGAAHNNRDLWALIPKQAGSVAPLRIATNADMQGTLDGKPIEVHHLTVTHDTSKTEVFSSPSNELLQAEWTDEGFALVRQGFKLTPPARPGAPPAAPPQSAATPGQGQPAAPQSQAPPPQQ